MKVTEFLGKPVLDKNLSEIGKISNMFIKPDKGLITSLIISAGEITLRKKEYEVKIHKIAEVGDYVILKIAKSDLKEIEPEEKEEKPQKSKLSLKKN
jgi:sporulation protein YlmC with PRC-barrel domain